MMFLAERNEIRRLWRPKKGKEIELQAQLATMGWTIGRTVKAPSQRSLERMVDNGIATCPDGCRVEPDGTCPHGLPSWLIILDVI